MKLDTTQPGLSALFFPHKGAMIQRLFERERAKQLTDPKILKGMSSRELWDWHNDYADRSGQRKVSRATAINGLNDLVDRNILSYTEESCKGGYRRIYSIAMTPEEFEHFIRVEIQGKLDLIFNQDWSRIPQ